MQMSERLEGKGADGASKETLRQSSGIEDGGYDVSPTPLLTWRMFTLGVLASMGGLIFGVHFSNPSISQHGF